MFDYNERGNTYESTATAKPWDAYGVLAPASIQHCLDVKKLAREKMPRTIGAGGRPDALYFARLDAALFHYASATRELHSIMAQSRERILKEKPPAMVIVASSELAFELEAVLFRASAFVDTVANYLARTIVGFQMPTGRDGRAQQVYFSNVRLGLAPAVGEDARAALVVNLLDECKPAFDEILLSIGRKTIRNYVAHEAQVQDLTGSQLVVYGLPDGRYLRLDQDVLELPLIGSVRSMTGALTHLAFQLARIMSTVQSDGSSDRHAFIALTKTIQFYDPKWAPPLLSWRDFESASPSAQTFTVSRFTDHGFELHQVMLDPEVINHASAE